MTRGKTSFEKFSPFPPFKNLKRRNRSVAGKDSPIPVKERAALFQRDFATGEIGCRKLMGPIPFAPQ
jgi:hypothetical protein